MSFFIAFAICYHGETIFLKLNIIHFKKFSNPLTSSAHTGFTSLYASLYVYMCRNACTYVSTHVHVL